MGGFHNFLKLDSFWTHNEFWHSLILIFWEEDFHTS